MTSLDTNILVAAMVSSSPAHQAASDGIKALNDLLCTTPTNIGEALRLLTHPRVFQKPLRLSKAVALLESFVDGYRIRVLDEAIDWWKELPDVEKDIPGLKGNEVFDARIALCLKSHGIKRIFTWDADFRKYPFLQAIQFSK